MKIKLALYLYFILNIVFAIVLIEKSTGFYNSVKEEIIDELPFSFRMATVAETEKRIEDNEVPRFSFSRQGEPPTPTAQLITSTDTVKFIRTEEYLALTSEEKRARFFQTVLVWEGMYLVLDDVRDLWQKELEEKGIHMRVAVMSRHRDFPDTQYSSGDSVFFHQAAKVDEYRTGLYQEVSLWGAYNITFPTMFSYAKKQFFIYGLLLLALVNSFILTLYHILKAHKIDMKALAVSTRILWGVPEATCFYLGENFVLDTDMNMVRCIVDGRQAKLSPRMIAILLEMLKSPYYYVSTKKLSLKICNAEKDPSTRIPQSIRNLRVTLEKNGIGTNEIEICNIAKKGYFLKIHGYNDTPEYFPSPEFVKNGNVEDTDIKEIEEYGLGKA